jgi:spermidine synthase
MTEARLDSHSVIFDEMMTHPLLFTHPHPKTISIIGDQENRILREVIKHANLTEIHQINTKPSDTHDPRVIYHDATTWTKPTNQSFLDTIISTLEPTAENLHDYFTWLHKDGLLIQTAGSAFDAQPAKTLISQLKTIGFHDFHLLTFPQLNAFSGWRIAVIALKYGSFKRPREKAIYNKSFKTHYYNFDIHRASMVLPEFMREAIT